ncbi:PDR/VanB family oxidoreductase [Mycolicibacterium sp.]|uniref:PDR/VanB family oxidoreductase n=1 Tax=Mycolicibacterium sp. TaxID=2320850 RepID=UPI0025E1C352|nr:PDR/VanB family oxidoreductase [Mycolicibacterium sp.]
MAAATQTIVREHEAELLVQKAELVAEDVVALTLVSPTGGVLPTWSPGAHIDLVLADGLVRQYSLCSAPGDDSAWRVGVLRTPDSRGGSRRVHETLTEGASVTIRGPRNHFPLAPAASYLFIAGGIGITPMLPMIAHAEATGATWRLLYGGRRRASMAFLPELVLYGDRVTIVPEDEVGFLDLDEALGTPQGGTLVYCCGPEGLLAAVENRCKTWPAGSLHLERFAAKPQDPSDVAAEGFELVLQQTGVTVTVAPDVSVFDAALEAGANVLGSCMAGVCGTCETEVVEGDVDHRDSVLNEEERAANEFMMICVSRCKSARLVLDI